MAPHESGPVPLDTAILPSRVIHAQLDVESAEPYTMLHLTMRFPVTITLRTPVMVKTVDPAGQVIMRSPLTAKIFGFPLTRYGVRSATDAIVGLATIPTIVGSVTVVVVAVLFDVVDVLIVPPQRNPVNGFAILRNASSFLFDADPIDETIAPETWTESFTRSTPVSV